MYVCMWFMIYDICACLMWDMILMWYVTHKICDLWYLPDVKYDLLCYDTHIICDLHYSVCDGCNIRCRYHINSYLFYNEIFGGLYTGPTADLSKIHCT